MDCRVKPGNDGGWLGAKDRRYRTQTSPKGGRWSSSVLIGTKLGASPIARSEAITATYMMIHMAFFPPARTYGCRFHGGNCQRGGRWNCGLPISTRGNCGAVPFLQRTAAAGNRLGPRRSL